MAHQQKNVDVWIKKLQEKEKSEEEERKKIFQEIQKQQQQGRIDHLFHQMNQSKGDGATQQQ